MTLIILSQWIPELRCFQTSVFYNILKYFSKYLYFSTFENPALVLMIFSSTCICAGVLLSSTCPKPGYDDFLLMLQKIIAALILGQNR